MVGSSMDGKRLDLNAPLMSVRRHVSGPLPPPPSRTPTFFANDSAADTSYLAETGGRAAARQWTRRSSLPLHKPDFKPSPVRNAGAIPFGWEQYPGQPKDGSGIGDGDATVGPVGGHLLASKLPPSRLSRRLSKEQKEPIRRDSSGGADDDARLPCPSNHASNSEGFSTTTATAVSGRVSTSSGNSRDVAKLNSSCLAEKTPISEEQAIGCDGEDEDAFSDALDTLSRVDTFSVNCSVSGLSDGVDTREPSGTTSTDSALRDFMMRRFLPAARAMTVSPSPYAPRKSPAPCDESPRRVIAKMGSDRRQSAPPLSYQRRPSHVLNYASAYHQTDEENNDDDESDEEEGDDIGVPGYPSLKGCGLLPRFCLKSSFCLLNPVPGMRLKGSVPMAAARRRLPQVKASHHGSVVEAEDEGTWEEVYKHKSGRGHQILVEEASKMTSESNQLSYWSDSQTADGSSSCRHSTGRAISPNRKDMSSFPFHERKNCASVPRHRSMGSEDDEVFKLSDKSSERYWEAMPRHRRSRQTSGSQSPTVEKTVYVDTVGALENPCFMVNPLDAKNILDYEGRMLKKCDDFLQENKFAEVAEANALHGTKRSSVVEITSHAKGDVLHMLQYLETEGQRNGNVNAVQLLLPPPLPKSPSESWLCRTLHSVASKNSATLSSPGIQQCPKKHTNRASPTGHKQEITIQKLTKQQIRFADVLAKPISED